jgi:hypothetical protein
MHDLRDFIIGLWRGRVSGIAGGVLVVFLLGWSVFSRNVPPGGIIFGCATIFFFVSTFSLWLRERKRAEKADGPFFAELSAEVVERMLLMDKFQKLHLKRMAVSGSIRVVDADMVHDIDGINTKTDWLHSDPSGRWTIQSAYLPAMQRYFVDHPIAPPDGRPGIIASPHVA